jgi:hypothetical protein
MIGTQSPRDILCKGRRILLGTGLISIALTILVVYHHEHQKTINAKRTEQPQEAEPELVFPSDGDRSVKRMRARVIEAQTIDASSKFLVLWTALDGTKETVNDLLTTLRSEVSDEFAAAKGSQVLRVYLEKYEADLPALLISASVYVRVGEYDFARQAFPLIGFGSCFENAPECNVGVILFKDRSASAKEALGMINIAERRHNRPSQDALRALLSFDNDDDTVIFPTKLSIPTGSAEAIAGRLRKVEVPLDRVQSQLNGTAYSGSRVIRMIVVARPTKASVEKHFESGDITYSEKIVHARALASLFVTEGFQVIQENYSAEYARVDAK